MRFRILGPLEVVGRNGPISITAARQKTVLSTLLLESNHIVSVERLVDSVWSDKPPATARSQIQICVSSLRSIMASEALPGWIHTRQPGYQLAVTAEDVDLLAFERYIALGRQESAAGRLAEAAHAYKDALALWQGEPFEGSPSLVLQGAATPLVERRLAAAEEYANVRIRLHQHEDLVSELMDLVERYPLREKLRVQLMLSLFHSGRRADALAAYRNGRNILVEQLGLEPGEQLRQMEQAILNDDPCIRIGSGIGGAAQIGPPTVPRMLPADLADITGREDVTQRIRTHILGPHGPATPVPMVAISGCIGVGKTILATHLAHVVSEAFPDGQLYARLGGATPTASADVLARFLRALGVMTMDVPDTFEERVEMFRARMADQRILVVLDDCPDEEQVRALTPATAGCAVILTSRRRLTGLSGALRVEVDVLGLDDAVELLARMVGWERVNAERTAARTLVQMCDAVPLALRVVGARLAGRPHWAVSHMVERLTDERRRLGQLAHGGLDVRATLLLAYRSLSPGARQLLRRLSQANSDDFDGWVCSPLADTDPIAAADLLDELVDARMVEVHHGRGRRARFRLHSLIRVFALERFGEEDHAQRQETVRRLVGAWLSLAERAHRAESGGDDTLIHGDAARWPACESVVDTLVADPLIWYDTEREGLLAAIRQGAEADLHEACWDLALASVTLFEKGNYFDDWRNTHEVALAATTRAGNRRGRAALLCSLGSLATLEQRYDDARPLLTEAAELFAAITHVHGYTLAQRKLAYLDCVVGNLDAAAQGFDERSTLPRRAGDRLGEIQVLTTMAQIRVEHNDGEAATGLLKLALVTAEDAEARRVHAQVLSRHGDLYLVAGELIEAERALQDVLDLVPMLRHFALVTGIHLAESPW